MSSSADRLVHAAALAAIVGFAGFTWADLDAVHTMRQGNGDLDAEIASNARVARLSGSRLSDLLDAREFVAHYERSAVASFDRTGDIVQLLNDAENGSGVTLADVDPIAAPPSARSTIVEVPFGMRFQGSFEQVLRFIDVLEAHAAPAVVVRGFTLESQFRRRDPCLLSGRIDCSILVGPKSRQRGGAAPAAWRAARLSNWKERRDPFVDPRRPSHAPDASELLPQSQRYLLEKLRFEVEVLKEDVRQADAYEREASRKYVALVGNRPITPDLFERVMSDARKAMFEVTDPELKLALKEEVLDVLVELAKSPHVRKR